MSMESLNIIATNHTPQVDFDPTGILKIVGRSLPEDVNKLFDPLIDFIIRLKVDKAIMDVNLDYFNTATSKKLLLMMKHLEANSNIDFVRVNWHYEEGDDDSMEMGEIYEESLLRTEFYYHVYAETEI